MGLPAHATSGNSSENVSGVNIAQSKSVMACKNPARKSTARTTAKKVCASKQEQPVDSLSAKVNVSVNVNVNVNVSSDARSSHSSRCSGLLAAWRAPFASVWFLTPFRSVLFLARAEHFESKKTLRNISKKHKQQTSKSPGNQENKTYLTKIRRIWQNGSKQRLLQKCHSSSVLCPGPANLYI